MIGPLLRPGIKLENFRPHRRIVEYWSSAGTMPAKAALDSSNNFFSREVEKAAEQAPRSGQMFRTLIIGPGYFSNLPLEYLLARGEVVGVEV